MQALPPGNTRHLSELLQGMKRVHTDEADARTLSPPHERALARALGMTRSEAPDGVIPWAAREAAEQLQAAAGQAWAWITPCYWAMGRDHATLTDPAALALREDESRALLAAMQPYFETDGITLHYLAPERWLAEGELFRHLPTASLDRVLSRNVDGWLPGEGTGERSAGPPQASSAPSGGSAVRTATSVGATERSAGPPQASSIPSGGSVLHGVASAAARTLRRLQNEMQMLLYTHPLNDVRAARRQQPVNSFWVSGTGALASALPQAQSEKFTLPRSLALAVLNDNWSDYTQAWAALDAGEVAQLLARQRAGETVQLTLCGERSAQTFATSRASLFSKISSFFAPKPIRDVLEQL